MTVIDKQEIQKLWNLRKIRKTKCKIRKTKIQKLGTLWKLEK